MDIYVVDFETYYDKLYSLSKLTMYEYVMDPRYETILLCWKNLVTEETGVIRGDDPEIDNKMQRFEGQTIVAHNAPFDAACMVWRHRVRPKKIYDTRAMAQAWLGPKVHGHGVSLEALARYYNLPRKLDAVKDMLGVHVQDMDPAQWDEYIEYCQRDVDLCGELFLRFIKDGFPKSELEVISLINRMYVYPQLRLDKELLQNTLNDNVTKTANLVITSGATEAELSSNPQFMRLFYEATGTRLTSADKNNPDMIAALEGKFGKKAQVLVQARLAVKSTIEKSRIERLLTVHDLFDGRLPIPLSYYAAHTGRCGGMDKINPQNFPRGSAIRKAIMAPKGYKLVVGDSSNIEARVLAWVARCHTLLEMFREGRDVYREFASVAFKKPPEEITKEERFVGKTCILGLGFGVGARKLHSTLTTGGSDITLGFAERLVMIYRNQYAEIPAFWSRLSEIIYTSARLTRRNYTVHGGVTRPLTGAADLKAVIKHEIINSQHGSLMRIPLPNGMELKYFVLPTARPGARENPEAIIGVSRRSGNTTVNLWHGLLCENIVQALARIVVFDQMMELAKNYPVVLTVHDEVVLCVPEEQAEEAKARMEEVMSTPPAWAKRLPVACEVSVAERYGEAK